MGFWCCIGSWWWWALAVAGLIAARSLWKKITGRGPQTTSGFVFVTGCDSGMGEVIAFRLAEKGFSVIAAVLLEESKAKFQGQPRLFPVQLDVTNAQSIEAAVAFVKQTLRQASGHLVGLFNCAGIAVVGPAEYMPLAAYERQIKVNFLGYVAVTQALLPLIKEAVARPGSEATRRGRIVFIGTGGGNFSPASGLLTAYMASKWAVEAFCQGFRLEMRLRNIPIDCCMINPGFVKPTRLIEEGKKNVARLWTEVPAAAKAEYDELVQSFFRFNEEEKGVHVSSLGPVAEEIMATGELGVSYKVGVDSQAAPFVGLLPIRWTDWLLRNTMFRHYTQCNRWLF